MQLKMVTGRAATDDYFHYQINLQIIFVINCLVHEMSEDSEQCIK